MFELFDFWFPDGLRFFWILFFFDFLGSSIVLLSETKQVITKNTKTENRENAN